MSFLSPNSAAQDYKIRRVSMEVPFSITANATPASKSHNMLPELSGVVYLRTEGKTSEVDAIEGTSATNFTTAVDATNAVFGIFVRGPAGIGKVRKILKVAIAEDGTSLASSLAVAKNGSSSSGVTALGNVALSVTGTGLDLASESPSIRLDLVVLCENNGQ